jgi:diadenosine tetraphosphate (Ap4A) HIT family hydrolase
MIYQNDLVYIKIEKSEIPWVKIFTQKPYREFSECNSKTKIELLRMIDIIEKKMIGHFQPTKINIASFGNYLPHLHFHVMARFENDAYFPEPMWGKKQRESALELPDLDAFYTLLSKHLAHGVL